MILLKLHGFTPASALGIVAPTGRLLCAWLLIAWPMLAGDPGSGFSSVALSVPATGKTGFTLLPPEQTGVHFSNQLSNARIAKNRLTEIGSGVALGDVDSDGKVDIYLGRMEGGNVLYKNLGGWEDLLLTTGSHHELQDMDSVMAMARSGGGRTTEERVQNLARTPRRETPSVAFRNQHDLTFQDVSATWGFNSVGVAHGMALADLDNDGDLDVVVNCMNADARILRNESIAPRLGVRLKGAGANSRGISARIQVTGGPVTQTQEMTAGGRYLSGDDAMRVFAAGEAKELGIEVTWRSGRRSVVKGALPNRIYTIEEAGAIAATPPTPTMASPPLFQELTNQLQHLHGDLAFDDFARDPLLPFKLSRLGPAVCVADLDGDGDDDLVVGGGGGGRAVAFLNDGHGVLTEWVMESLPKTNLWDQTGIAAWHGADGRMRLLIGESTWEAPSTHHPPIQVLAVAPLQKTSAAAESVPGANFSPGPIALADVQGDGNLEIFVGGRLVPGRFPEPADSWLLSAEAGRFNITQRFARLGLVSGAVFSDLDGDGDPDLLLACQWDSIRFFRNDRGKLVEATREWGLSEFRGLWNGIAIGDFDSDGRPDLVVTQNSRATRLFRNQSGKPGVRISARGPKGNLKGVGVGLRLNFGDRLGPWREIQAGSGYGSQNSSTVLLGAPVEPIGLEVLWPGRRRELLVWPPGARSVEVSETGIRTL